MPRHSTVRPALAVFLAALAGVAGLQPAAAQESAGAPYAHDHGQDALPGTPLPPSVRTEAAPVQAHGAMPVADDAVPGRAAWLAECRRRMADRDSWQDDLRDEWGDDRRHRRERRPAPRGPDECEAYLDSYYAQARAAHAQPVQSHAGQPMVMMHGQGMAAGHGGGACCQPSPAMAAPSGPYMLVPVMLPARKANCEREIIETVEEVVPARRAVPRRSPPRDKRIRIAPDKRVPAR